MAKHIFKENFECTNIDCNSDIAYPDLTMYSFTASLTL